MQIEKLKNAKIAAMREKKVIDRKILSLLHSNALMLAKKEMRELTDDDVLTAAKTLIKRNKNVIAEIIEKKQPVPSLLNDEIDILYTFLPAQKSADEIKTIVDEKLAAIPENERERKTQGIIMKQLKQEYDDIDMSFASKYVQELLA